MTATCPRSVMGSSETGSSGGTSGSGLPTSRGNLPVSPDPFPRSASRTDAPRLPQTPSTGPLRGRTLRVSCLEPQVGLAHAHHVAAAQPARSLEPRPVQERPVGRAEVLDPDTVLPRLEACVAGRGELVGRDRDVVLVPATNRQLRRVQVEVLAFVEVRAPHDDEPA